MRTPLQQCSLAADDGASPPPEWCTASVKWCMAAGGVVHHGAGVGPAARVSILRGQGVVLARRTHSNKIFLLDRHSNY